MAKVRSGGGTPAIAAAVWAGAYAAIALTGERLSTQLIEGQWQLLPLDVLRAHPIRSVWNLHVQPPMWNLLVGSVDRWSPLPLAMSMQLVLVASGCVLAACIASVLCALGLGRAQTLVVTALATLNASVLLAAFRPQYELPVAALLAALVALAMQVPGPRSGRVLVLSSVAITALVLTRSLYHPVVIPLVLLLVWRLHAGLLSRRAVLAAAAIPLVLVGGWALKNQVMFGRPTMASWTGMNLLRSVAPAVDADELEALRRDGTIDLPDGSFLPLADYEGVVPPCSPAHDDPALVIAARPVTSGADDLAPVEEVTNFNHECFLPIYDAARRDALAIARAKPDRWLLARVWSVNNWFELPTPSTSSPLATAVQKLTTLTFVGVAHPGLPSSWPPFWVNHWTWTLTVPVASVALVIAALRRLRGLRRGLTTADAGFLLGGFLLVWTFSAGIAFELGEQARFRAPTDPIVLALSGALLLRWWTRRRAVPVELAADERAPRTAPSGRVLVAGAVVVAGVALVLVRQGEPVLRVVDATTAAAQVEAVTSRTTIGTPTTSTIDSLPVTPTTAAPAPSTTSAAPAPSVIAPPGPAAIEPGPPAAVTTMPIAPAAAVAASPRTICREVVHLGDSNLGMSIGLFRAAYDELGVSHLVDFANGRGADIAVDGTTAREAIAAARASTAADGRCWVIALSGADAVQAQLHGTDPTPTIRTIVDAIGGEPTVWIPPVLTSATSEWNLVASTTYDLALAEVVAGHPNITVFDWPAIALQHLDQFQADGIHYTKELYALFVRSVIDALTGGWDLGA